ncbi:hypothetical protein [Tsukamurella soli]|uniref:Uncharacterized protein n=1 Tax=Tsukamurella soli TaxID=644556 RepID=A0ABP8JJE8_9ACTN
MSILPVMNDIFVTIHKGYYGGYNRHGVYENICHETSTPATVAAIIETRTRELAGVEKELVALRRVLELATERDTILKLRHRAVEALKATGIPAQKARTIAAAVRDDALKALVRDIEPPDCEYCSGDCCTNPYPDDDEDDEDDEDD